MKRIAVLTSGGDAPGMNAAVRAVVHTARQLGMEVYGIKYGYKGLIENNMELMDYESVSDKMQNGGTFLYTARCLEFKTKEGVMQGVKVCKDRGIEGIVVVGGDGSFRGARDLSNSGIPCIGIPATIDNDIACCDYTIGYDTSLNTIVQMIDRVNDTMESHDRCSVVEVMGRGAGYLTLTAGITVGATAVLIPEVEYDIERDVIEKIRKSQKEGKHHFIIMVSEAIGEIEPLARKIENELGVESKALVLGHVQRGGSPSARDRLVASELGNKAVKLLHEGKSNRVLAVQREQIFDLDINEALDMKKEFDTELYNTALEISI